MASRREISHRALVGRLGEDVACQYLEGKGYRIIERNFLRPWGEIDVIAVKHDVVRFVEVKTISREMTDEISREISSNRPEEQIHAAKLHKIARTAALYMAARKDDREYQIDAVGVFLDLKRKKAQCRLFEQIV